MQMQVCFCYLFVDLVCAPARVVVIVVVVGRKKRNETCVSRVLIQMSALAARTRHAATASVRHRLPRLVAVAAVVVAAARTS